MSFVSGYFIHSMKMYTVSQKATRQSVHLVPTNTATHYTRVDSFVDALVNLTRKTIGLLVKSFTNKDNRENSRKFSSMNQLDRISALPLEVLAHVLQLVPKKEHLFTVSKKFYNAACIASKSDYRFMLNGNSKVGSFFCNVL